MARGAIYRRILNDGPPYDAVIRHNPRTLEGIRQWILERGEIWLGLTRPKAYQPARRSVPVATDNLQVGDFALVAIVPVVNGRVVRGQEKL